MLKPAGAAHNGRQLQPTEETHMTTAPADGNPLVLERSPKAPRKSIRRSRPERLP